MRNLARILWTRLVHAHVPSCDGLQEPANKDDLAADFKPEPQQKTSALGYDALAATWLQHLSVGTCWNPFHSLTATRPHNRSLPLQGSLRKDQVLFLQALTFRETTQF